MPTLHTKRLVLRAARADDLDPLHAIFSDPRAMRYWDRPAYDAPGPTQAFLDWFMTPQPDTREEYILELDGRCIGKAGVWARPEVGYILHPDVWGMGLAKEALEAILPRAFGKWPEQDHLTAETDPRNLASVRLLRRLGFRLIETRSRDFLYGGTEWCDTALYQCQRPEFQRPECQQPEGQTTS